VASGDLLKVTNRSASPMFAFKGHPFMHLGANRRIGAGFAPLSRCDHGPVDHQTRRGANRRTRRHTKAGVEAHVAIYVLLPVPSI
jgi:hypothetical protein